MPLVQPRSFMKRPDWMVWSCLNLSMSRKASMQSILLSKQS